MLICLSKRSINYYGYIYLRAFAVRSDILPFDALEFKEKVKDINWMNKIDKCVSNIALRLQVHRKVEVVILSFVVDVDHLKKLHLFKLVRDVPHHNSCSFFFFCHDPIEINVVA